MEARGLWEATQEARAVVNRSAVRAALVSWVPGSTLALGALDHAMVRDIARAFALERFRDEAALATFGASRTARYLLEVLSFLPGPGWVLKALIAGAVTKSAGEAAIVYARRRAAAAEEQRASSAGAGAAPVQVRSPER